jgi:DNA-binding NarL/FixJ family response regulator
MPTQTDALKVSIVEDDAEIREHLVDLISNASGFALASQHSDARVAIEVIPTTGAQVVLMDVNLPGMSGIEGTRALKQKAPDLHIVMLTIYEDAEVIFESLKAGASGYLLKRTTGPKLLEAIREVRAGGSPMSSQIARKVVQYFNDRGQGAPELDQLTQREKTVLDALARGQLYKEIADGLGMSLDTVRSHLQHIYQKLHVHTRTEAVVKYLRK